MKQPIEWHKKVLSHHRMTIEILRKQVRYAINAYRQRKAWIRQLETQIALSEKRGLAEFDADTLGIKAKAQKNYDGEYAPKRGRRA